MNEWNKSIILCALKGRVSSLKEHNKILFRQGKINILYIVFIFFPAINISVNI